MAMNGSLITADGTTHIKILILSLLASLVVVWVGLSASSTVSTRRPIASETAPKIATAAVTATTR
jgi:hypothetical protein